MSKFNHNMSAISDGARHAGLHNAHAASDPCTGAVRREAAAAYSLLVLQFHFRYDCFM